MRVGDTFGDIVETALLATHVRTIKNGARHLAHGVVLGSSVINFSRREHAGADSPHSVTIGYDAPWRKVHDLLIGAALATPGMRKDPPPFVWQTALNDFYVTYEINAYTSSARDGGHLRGVAPENPGRVLRGGRRDHVAALQGASRRQRRGDSGDTPGSGLSRSCVPRRRCDRRIHPAGTSPPPLIMLAVRQWLPAYRTEWLPAGSGRRPHARRLSPAGRNRRRVARRPACEAGLYACLFSGLVFWLFCSSRHTVVTVTSALSLLVGASVGELSAGDPARHAAMAACLALLVSAIAFVAWLARAGNAIGFFFRDRARRLQGRLALYLASTQLPKLFGFKARTATSGSVPATSSRTSARRTGYRYWWEPRLWQCSSPVSSGSRTGRLPSSSWSPEMRSSTLGSEGSGSHCLARCRRVYRHSACRS